MKNMGIFRILGIIALAAVFGSALAGCDDEPPPYRNDWEDEINDAGSSVDTRYRGTYRSKSYSGNATAITSTSDYTYIVAAAKVEYTYSTNGQITTNTIYDEAWTEGNELWVRQNNTRSLIGKFSDSSTLTAGSRVYTTSSGPFSVSGTWTSYSTKYDFSSSGFEQYYNDKPYTKGTYSTSNNTMTMTITSMGSYGLSSYSSYLDQDSSKQWYTRTELKTAYLDYLAKQGYSGQNLTTQAENFETNTLDKLYTTSTVSYGLWADSLFLGGATYTKE